MYLRLLMLVAKSSTQNYKALIGADTIEIVKRDCKCIVEQGSSTYSIPFDCDNDPGFCVDVETNYVLAHLRKPSDGFVLAESQKAGPDLNYPVEFLEGSNHMQVKNDSNMRFAIERIFDEGLDGNYFKTLKR